jgi:LmbE family N-acetylglucosaminyl deacetylase
MLPLRLSRPSGADSLSVLAIGAHADDIEIGCGGTLLTLAETHPGADVTWVVLSGNGLRADEARASADEFLAGFRSSRVVTKDFRDGYFPHSGADVKDYFEELKAEIAPDVVFTHQRSDLHQDHRLVCELTWNTFRNHLVLEYEIPKYDGDLGSPNVFVPISEAASKRKVDALLAHFATQRDKRWFAEDLFLATLRLRGMESNSPSGLAEAFTCRKLVLS